MPLTTWRRLHFPAPITSFAFRYLIPGWAARGFTNGARRRVDGNRPSPGAMCAYLPEPANETEPVLGSPRMAPYASAGCSLPAPTYYATIVSNLRWTCEVVFTTKSTASFRQERGASRSEQRSHRQALVRRRNRVPQCLLSVARFLPAASRWISKSDESRTRRAMPDLRSSATAPGRSPRAGGARRPRVSGHEESTGGDR